MTAASDATTTNDPPFPVTLFDYGVGNLHSIKKALESAGAVVTVTSDAADLLEAPAFVLPGVGAFGACMEPLQEHRDAIRDRLLAGTPCLAVCIGMQLLFESSAESPGVEGIGFFRGRIQAFPREVGKVPHMGWNTVHAPLQLPRWDNRAGAGLGWAGMLPGSGAHLYYVHSYYVQPEDPVSLLATTYGPGGDAPTAENIEFAAVVARGNTLATQFHPEKSSSMGLEIVARWVAAARKRHPLEDPASKP
jgi:imidazole glycerol-phosphate synthase subunit HisH